MYINFTAHLPNKSVSSSTFFDYLEKENSLLKDIYFKNRTYKNDVDVQIPILDNYNISDDILNYNSMINIKRDGFGEFEINVNFNKDEFSVSNQGEYTVSRNLLKDKIDKIFDEEFKDMPKKLKNDLKKDAYQSFTNNIQKEYLKNENHFYNHSYDPNNLHDNIILKSEAINAIDNNRGTQSLKLSNYYTFCISLSAAELRHLDKLAEKELENRGISKYIDTDNTELNCFYLEQVNELKKIQLQLYTKDIMNEYARLMDREIYVHQDQLPSDRERLKFNALIDDKYKDWMRSKNFTIETFSNNNDYIEINEFFKINDSDVYYIRNEDTNNEYVRIFIPASHSFLKNNILNIDGKYYNQNILKEIDRENFLNDRFELEKYNYSILEEKETSKYTTVVDKFKINDVELQSNLGKKNLYVSIEKGQLIDPLHFRMNSKLFEEEIYRQSLSEAKKLKPEIKEDCLNEFLKQNKYVFQEDILYRIEKDEKIELTKDEQKNFYNVLEVKINRAYDKEFNLKNPMNEYFKITDFLTKTYFDNSCIEIKKESEKAMLVKVFYNDNYYNFWTPKKLADITDDKIGINRDTLQNAVDRKNLYTDYDSSYEGQKTRIRKDKEIEDYFISIPIDNNICVKVPQTQAVNLTNRHFNYLKEQAQLEYYKSYFKKEFDLISKNNTDSIKKIEEDFKKFLEQEKNIIVGERIKKVKIPIKILKKGNDKSLIKVKKESKDLQFYVGNKYIDFKQKILEMKENNLKKLIDNAEERDKAYNLLIPLDDKNCELTTNKKNEIYITYSEEIKGLTNPIVMTFPYDEKIGYNVKQGEYLFKKEKAIENEVKKEYGDVKENIKNEIWNNCGYNTEKRKITGEDLLYYAKIEQERVFKETDREVLLNEDILREIDNCTNDVDKKKLEGLLHRNVNNEVIKPGVVKDGDNTHIHIVVSRHDKTSINPKDKVSMSPITNNKDDFNRNEFRQNCEEIFDNKFQYDRPIYQSYLYHINKYKPNFKDMLLTKVGNELKKELLNQSGVYESINTINPIKDVKKIILSGIPIPTRIPTNKIQLLLEAAYTVKKIIGLGF